MELDKKQMERYLSDFYKEDVSIDDFRKLGAGVHGIGYSIEFVMNGEKKKLILKTLFPENFGHDHYSDRAQVLILAHSNFNRIPRHVRSVDVLGVSHDSIVSLGTAKEFYLLMEEAHGTDYFKDLDRILETKKLEDNDLEKARILSDYLTDLHKEKKDSPVLYKRRIRDLVGHGECIMGILDTYPEVKFTNNDEMTEIAGKCVGWWGKIKDRSERLCTVHGDYHPGNIWWSEDNSFTLLDRSRGEYGEPADDVSSLTMNYIFYSLRAFGKLEGPFLELFRVFLENYLNKTKDKEMLRLIQPFYAFRGIVVSNPIFYPQVSDDVRRKMFNFINRLLDQEEFSIESVNELI